MGEIALRGMKFYAYHGYYDEEQIIGGNYEIDLVVTTNVGAAAMKDDLQQTINYETLYQLCALHMRKKYRLIETLAANIIADVKNMFGNLSKISITVHKLHPPLGGEVAAATFTTDASYTAACGRCGKTFVCYGDQTCWCMQPRVHSKTLELLRLQYKKCLCKACLDEFAG